MLQLRIYIQLVVCITFAYSHKTFVATFQKSKSDNDEFTTDEWMEYSAKIPNATEFTACQWMKVEHFSRDLAANVWSYCIIGLHEEGYDNNCCLQTTLHEDRVTANQNLQMFLYLPHQSKVTIPVESFLHQTWVHFCWLYSATNEEHKVYYNGKLIGSIMQKREGNAMSVIHGTEFTKESALIIGQEPDDIRGGYDKFEAFNGQLAEFNIWNFVLNETTITSMAQCKTFPKGN